MTLSDKIAVDDDGVGFYYEPDLKQALKELKERVEDFRHLFIDSGSTVDELIRNIDEIFGAELNG